MNYEKLYKTICSNGQRERHLIEYEKHHIQPRCLHGTNVVTNLTKLTYREHFLAHWLLIKIYPNNPRLLHAFGMMNVKSPDNIRIRSKHYEIAKLAHRTAMFLENPMHDKSISLKMGETKKRLFSDGSLIPRKIRLDERINISKRMIGSENPIKKFPDKHNFKNKSYTKNTVWVLNPTTNQRKRVALEEIPEGFIQCGPRGNKNEQRK